MVTQLDLEIMVQEIEMNSPNVRVNSACLSYEGEFAQNVPSLTAHTNIVGAYPAGNSGIDPTGICLGREALPAFNPGGEVA